MRQWLIYFASMYLPPCALLQHFGFLCLADTEQHGTNSERKNKTINMNGGNVKERERDDRWVVGGGCPGFVFLCKFTWRAKVYLMVRASTKMQRPRARFSEQQASVSRKKIPYLHITEETKMTENPSPLLRRPKYEKCQPAYISPKILIALGVVLSGCCFVLVFDYAISVVVYF